MIKMEFTRWAIAVFVIGGISYLMFGLSEAIQNIIVVILAAVAARIVDFFRDALKKRHDNELHDRE